MVADGRFPEKRILAEARWRLNGLISGGGYSAYQMVFGSGPADSFRRGDGKDGALLFAQGPLLSVQFVQQWKLRMMAQGAALKEVANSKLRRPLAYNESSKCTDARIGDAALLRKAVNRKSTPQWRGPVETPDIDGAGATVTF